MEAHSDSVYDLPKEEVTSALEEDLPQNESQLQMPTHPSVATQTDKQI
jgi:hypothetical protein